MIRESGELRVGVAIPAAGSGKRLGGRDKAFLELAGEPVLRHALRPFLEHPSVSSIAVALAPRFAFPPPAWLVGLDARLCVVAGAKTRTGSVLAALDALDPSVDVVVVHDGARPLVTREIIDRCIAGVSALEGVVSGWPIVDTLKETDSRGRVLLTRDRASLWSAQTPQAFPYGPIVAAYRRGVAEGLRTTDDAQVFTHFGGSVRMVEGSPRNLKITFPEDLGIAEYLLVGQRGAAPAR
ncbi:MAG: 2-C-methyl-D-erythritol 4-phosphate cytidylyltransferase [Gemmatimonadetes bacterium]|nr:2-C-methyl-D-erythritol 4-phosphate cytidylyltransferase [Gemmatimonadota bacterium]